MFIFFDKKLLLFALAYSKKKVTWVYYNKYFEEIILFFCEKASYFEMC